MRQGISALMVVLATSTTTPPASADSPNCPADGNLHEATAGCVQEPIKTLTYVAEHSDHTFRVALACVTENAICPEAPTCDDGYVYDIWEDTVLLPWEAPGSSSAPSNA